MKQILYGMESHVKTKKQPDPYHMGHFPVEVKRNGKGGPQSRARLTTSASWAQYSFVAPADGPSTMMRHIFCVPE